MKKFEITQEEMDEIISINENNKSPGIVIMHAGYMSGNTLAESINNYWRYLGNKYGFDSRTISAGEGLLFNAEETEEFKTFPDGDMICATGLNFENLQDSIAGFGENESLAVADLISNEKKRKEDLA